MGHKANIEEWGSRPKFNIVSKNKTDINILAHKDKYDSLTIPITLLHQKKYLK